MNKKALIDADSLCYICSKDNLEESITNLDNFINKILKEVNVEEAIFFISKGPYFRNKIYPEYKSNRPPSALLFLKELKEHLELKYSAFSFIGVEADDLVAYFYTKIENSIICSADKDVFKQIPGTHYNYRNNTYITTTDNEAEKFLWHQTLMGDSVDCIKGVPGIGEKTAEKILNQSNSYVKDVFYTYLQYYNDENIAMHYMQLNFKLVYLLKTETDFKLYFDDVPVVDKFYKNNNWLNEW